MATVSFILDRVREAMDSTNQIVLSGRCKTYEDYKASCARLRALNEVIAWATDTEKPRESTEDSNSR